MYLKTISKNLPNVVVTDLQIQYMKGKIRAATYGRGLWESDLYVSPGTFQVNAVDIPVTGGDVAGDGIFQPGQTATMTAKPETGWDFKSKKIYLIFRGGKLNLTFINEPHPEFWTGLISFHRFFL